MNEFWGHRMTAEKPSDFLMHNAAVEEEQAREHILKTNRLGRLLVKLKDLSYPFRKFLVDVNR